MREATLPSGASRCEQLSSATFICPFLPILDFCCYYRRIAGIDSCGHGWLVFPSRLDEKVSLLAATWGCFYALDMEPGRGEGSACVVPALLSLENPLTERPRADSSTCHHVSMVLPSRLLPGMSNKLEQIGMRDYQALSGAAEPNLPLHSL